MGTVGPSDSSQRTRTIGVSFRTNPSQLDARLPQNFERDGRPIVTVTIGYMKEINWPAGHGHNVAVFLRRIAGRKAVLPSPSLQSSERICESDSQRPRRPGLAQAYGEIPELRVRHDIGDAHGHVSWDGFTFLELDLRDLQEEAGNARGASLPSLMWKCLSTTGEWWVSGVGCATISPVERGRRTVVKRWSASRDLKFNRATWEELPTLVHIVNAFADLEIIEVVGASMVDTLGGDDLRGQRILR
jgi:hypothetical protein